MGLRVPTEAEKATRRQQQPTTGEDKNLLSSIAGGAKEFVSSVGEGVQLDPFIATALNSIEGIEGINTEALNEIRQRAEGSTVAQVGQLIGEFLPTLLMGIGTGGVGAVAGRTLVQGAAKKMALQDAARTALGTAARTQAKEGAKKGLLRDQMERVGLRAAEKAGTAKQIQGVPGLQRTAESAGFNLGVGGLIGTQDLARGKSPTEALKSAALVTALGAGIDLGLVGGARLLFPRMRSVRVDEIRKRFLEKNSKGVSPQDKVAGIVSAEASKIDNINAELRKVLNVDTQQMELGFSPQLKLSTILEEGGEQATKVQDLVRRKRAAFSVKKQFQSILDNEGVVNYVGQGPGSSIGFFSPKFLTAPESFFGAFGETGNRFFSQLKTALTKSQAEETIAEGVFSSLSNDLRKLVGASNREWKNGYGKNLDMAHAWESGGEEGVKAYMRSIGKSNEAAEKAIAIWKQREKSDWDLFQVRGLKIGGKEPANLEELGVLKWITHGTKDKPVEELAKEMVEFGGMSEMRARALLRKHAGHMDPDLTDLNGVRTNDPLHNGPLDFNRTGRGTTKDKILGTIDPETGKRVGGGMPLNPNVWDSGYQAQRAGIRRIHTDPFLGGAVNTEKGRIVGGTVDDLVKAVEAEGYNGARFRTTLETMTGRTYYAESMRKWASALTSLQVASKLPMAFLANASQPILTATWAGIKPSMKGALALTSKARREEFAQAMAIHNHIIKGLGRSLDDEGLVLTSFEKVADWTLRFTGFNNIEKFNRIHGAAATQAMIRDRLSRGWAGNLRGTRLDSSRKMLGEVGLDLDTLVRDMKNMTPDEFFASQKYLDIESAALIQGAQKTQFFPGPTRTPAFWRSPLGRVLFQFKTFAVGQSRFMRDAVLTEYSNGNLAPLATYLAAAPIAGELVADARSLIKNKDRDEYGIMRGLTNISYVGGMGLVTDAIGQARWGKLEGFFLGPNINDLFGLAEALAQGEMGEIRKMGERQAAYRLTNFLMGVGTIGTETVLEYLDSVGSEGETKTTVDVGSLLTDRINQKGK